MIYLILILSFYLEGLLNILLDVSFLIPLFSLMSIIVIYSYLKDEDKKYFIICLLVGLLYDVVYTNTLFLNASLFLLIGYITTRLYKYCDSYLNYSLYILFIILLYRLLTFLLLVFINYIDYDMYIFFYSVVNSIVINILYISLFYFFFRKLRIIKHD